MGAGIADWYGSEATGFWTGFGGLEGFEGRRTEEEGLVRAKRWVVMRVRDGRDALEGKGTGLLAV